MTESRSTPVTDEESHASQSGATDGTEFHDATACHETVDPDTRDEMLAEYSHRCQTCGRAGPGNGGLATLHVHHLRRDPDACGLHDPENLTVLCRPCHNWHHQQTTDADVPVDISEADQSVLLRQDIEMLRIFAEDGPATTGEIADALTTDLSAMAIRERLWVLMGLDNIVESRDRQVVDRDVESGEWGLTSQIEQPARGRIPDDPQTLLQRIEDEYVRQALERGCDRAAVADVLDVARRTTFYKEKRAAAYDFPLAALETRGGGSSQADTTNEQPLLSGRSQKYQKELF